MAEKRSKKCIAYYSKPSGSDVLLLNVIMTKTEKRNIPGESFMVFGCAAHYITWNKCSFSHDSNNILKRAGGRDVPSWEEFDSQAVANALAKFQNFAACIALIEKGGADESLQALPTGSVSIGSGGMPVIPQAIVNHAGTESAPIQRRIIRNFVNCHYSRCTA